MKCSRWRLLRPVVQLHSLVSGPVGRGKCTMKYNLSFVIVVVVFIIIAFKISMSLLALVRNRHETAVTVTATFDGVVIHNTGATVSDCRLVVNDQHEVVIGDVPNGDKLVTYSVLWPTPNRSWDDRDVRSCTLKGRVCGRDISIIHMYSRQSGVDRAGRLRRPDASERRE